MNAWNWSRTPSIKLHRTMPISAGNTPAALLAAYASKSTMYSSLRSSVDSGCEHSTGNGRNGRDVSGTWMGTAASGRQHVLHQVGERAPSCQPRFF